QHGRRAAGWRQKAEQQPDRRRLPGAIRTQEAEDSAGLDPDRQVIDSPGRLEIAGQSIRLDRRLSHGAVCSASAAADGVAPGPTIAHHEPSGNRRKCPIRPQLGENGRLDRSGWLPNNAAIGRYFYFDALRATTSDAPPAGCVARASGV